MSIANSSDVMSALDEADVSSAISTHDQTCSCIQCCPHSEVMLHGFHHIETK
jgi:hypothetical protein